MESDDGGGAREASGPHSTSWRTAVAVEMAKASPKLLLAILLLLALALLRQPVAALLDRSTEIGLGPVTLKAAEAKLRQVKEPIKLDSVEQARYFSPEQIGVLTSRYADALSGGRRAGLLWVDDNPRNNKVLVDFLDLVGVNVIIARSYSEAIARLEERSFNVIVSDWSRPDDAVEQRAKAEGDQFWGSGPQLGRTLARSGCGRRMILFSSASSDETPIPPGVLSQTNNYYDLLLMIADAIREATPRCLIDSAA